MIELITKKKYRRCKISATKIILAMTGIFIIVMFPLKGQAAPIESYDFDSQTVTFTLHDASDSSTDSSTDGGGLFPSTGEKKQNFLIGLGVVIFVTTVGYFVVNKRKGAKKDEDN